ncbi:MAG: HAMP domain-containing protein [Anaerolineales bacterium]|nr:HAMP domain-containing protein [Anaerolineales bacterium]
MKTFKFSLFWKILLATFAAGLIPLLLITFRSVTAINATGKAAQDVAAQELDEKSIEALQVRATEIVHQISALLEASVEDTLYVAQLIPDENAYLDFYRSHSRQVWHLNGSEDQITKIIYQKYLYTEMAFADASGQEQLRIRNGELLPPEELRNISIPANTTYRTETYFSDAVALPQGEVYVSPVMAWYSTNPLQPAKATNADESRFQYGSYEAVIRFAAPVYDEADQLLGVVVLTLDHHHIMEIANHVQSSFGNVPYPDYASGNYAYLLDYEGWLIAHPDLSTLRGLDENGTLMPTQMQATVDLDLPFNMLTSDLKQQAVEISSAVLRGETGVSHSLTRQGTPKVDIYIPIPFAYGVYQENGIFGGVVLSEAVTNVEQAGKISSGIIGQAVDQIRQDLIWIVAVSLIILIGAAVLLSRNLNQPIRQLTEAARIMEKGELDLERLDHLLKLRLQDEVTELARVFKQMAQAVQMRERRLREEVTALRIQIDQVKKKEEVERITQSEVFKNLQEKAAEMRARRKARLSGEDQES